MSLQNPEPVFTVNYFTLDDALLTINVTDTPRAIKPPEDVEEDEKGIKRWYRREPLSSATSKYWRGHIADELVHKFLLKDAAGLMRYTLTDFPEGYYLYSHSVSRGRPFTDIRKDFYLFGGGHKFRSTNEVIYHFAWLMSGMQRDRCRCTYCTPDKALRRKQGNINKLVEKEWSAFKDKQALERLQEFRIRRQAGAAYVPPPPPVNVFNEDMFLRRG